MSEKTINWQVELVSLVRAIDAANTLDDVMAFTEMALEQLEAGYKIGSRHHKALLLLQAAQDILEAEVKTLQRELGECQKNLSLRRQ